MGAIPHTTLCPSQAILLTGYKQVFCATPLMLYTAQRCDDPGCDYSHPISKTLCHHQRHFRFSEKALRRQLFPHLNLPLVQFFPSILKPRAGSFPEPFNGCKDSVQGADQWRLGAKICSQKAKEISKHSIQWTSAKNHKYLLCWKELKTRSRQDANKTSVTCIEASHVQ